MTSCRNWCSSRASRVCGRAQVQAGFRVLQIPREVRAGSAAKLERVTRGGTVDRDPQLDQIAADRLAQIARCVRMSVHQLLDRLEGVRKSGEDRWNARCPAHEDRSPSLSIRELPDGRILLKCFAGCETGNVLASAGMRSRTFFRATRTSLRAGTQRAELAPNSPRRWRTNRSWSNSWSATPKADR